MSKEHLQRLDGLRMQRDRFPLLGFVLRQSEPFAELFLVEIVQIGPLKAEQIADTESGMGAKDDKDMVSELPFEQEVTGQGPKIFLIADRFGRRHSKNPFCRQILGFETALLQRGRCNGI